MADRFGLVEVTPPTLEPVTLAEAKNHLRVDGNEDNAAIERMIKTARQYAEAYTGRQFIQATLRMYLPQFVDEIVVAKPPLISVSSIQYVDGAGSTQTLSSTKYSISSGAEPATITPSFGNAWPGVRQQYGAVQINYTAGYGTTAASVPECIRQAILLHVGGQYEIRAALKNLGEDEFNLDAVHSLLGPYRVMWDW